MIVALMGVVVAMPGCVQKPTGATTPTTSRATSDARWLNAAPKGVLSANEASAAIASLRYAVINGHKSSNDWLHALSDGTLVATGYMSTSSGPWPEASSNLVLFGLEVPETVGGFTLYHLVPLVGSDSTSATVDGKPLKLANVWGMPTTGAPFDRTMYRLKATFSVQNGWIRADSMTFTSKEPTADALRGYRYPDASFSDPRIAQDATLPAAPSPWLDVSDAPRAPAFTLDGWSNYIQTSGEAALAGVNVPDRLGPAAVYDLASVNYARSSDVPAALTQDEPSPQDFAPFRYPVRLQRERLVAVTR